MVEAFKYASLNAGAMEARRATQNLAWMYQLIDDLLRVNIKSHQSVQSMLPAIEQEVREAAMTPLAGAQKIIALSQQ
jgi:LAO/AO transport system kinase